MYEFKSTEPLLNALKKHKKALLSRRSALSEALYALEKDCMEIEQIEDYVRAQEEEAQVYKRKIFNSAEKRVNDVKRDLQRALDQLNGITPSMTPDEHYNWRVASTALVFETILNNSIRGFSSKDGLKRMFQSVLFPYVYDHLPIKEKGEDFFIDAAPSNLVTIIKDVRREIVLLEEKYGKNFSKERNWEAAKSEIKELWETLVFDQIYDSLEIFDGCTPWPWKTMEKYRNSEAKMVEFPHIYDTFEILGVHRDTAGEMNGLQSMEKEIAEIHSSEEID